MMKNRWLGLFIAGGLAAGGGTARADFLFAPGTNFIEPALNYSGSNARYSEWRNFYSKSTVGNLPDYYSEFGGVKVGSVWQPTPRPLDDPNFPAEPSYYTSDRPNAFWNVNNPTITQTNAATGYISSTGNFYGLNGAQSFRLDDNTAATDDPSGMPGYTAGTVVFQFQTDGQFVDLSTIRLVYMDGGIEKWISAADLNRAEMLREFMPPEGASSDPSSAEGYESRFAIQWNLTGLGISEYSIVWDTESHTSLQQVSLDSSDQYVAAIPTTRAWTGGSGSWSDGANWLDRSAGGTYGTGPVENGNVRFENTSAALVTLANSQTVGEIVFTTANDLTLQADAGVALTANTGISTTAAATGVYSIKSDYVFGAVNLFDIAAGTVRIDGDISGGYGFVKTGSGALALSGNNSFTGAMDIQAGSVRLTGSNATTATVSVRGGELSLASATALTTSGVVKVGFDSTYFDNPVPAALFIDGAYTLGRSIEVVANNSQVILGARNTGGQNAIYSGAVSLTSGAADVRLRTEGATDRVNFTGAMTGGGTNRTVTVDGPGTVIFSGTAKNYNDATVVSSGTLVLETTIGAAAGTGYGSFTVKNGAVFHITSTGRLNGFAGDIFTPQSVLTIEAGGKVKGAGVIARKVATTGTMSVIEASRSEGTLTLASLDASQGVTFQFDLQQTVDPSIPLVAITGEFKGSVLDSGVRIAFTNLAAVEAGQAYTLLSYGSLSGLTLSDLYLVNTGLVLDQSFGTGGWKIENGGIQVQFSAVPEPSTWALLGLCGVMLLLFRRKLRRLTA